ncbi:DUF924 domain-containing protein [Phormidesmis priestleyi ULC007]|uniref:DUF924 domain-containing protein n=1 Tax=Phormidesmis priestleyi ULC007 TaxID=1920490 RepID=A0A2T1D709_9CYAN|nr:DUF924 family protein [Phormidesmis priestleyi]PSB16303.1 DUF924 domain-containing protein [Phormidesmis priestleyi ULC007]PZO46998.1 MAG: DUF924 domain-containing protein [Phormidesmis priestleyi]
MTQLDQILNFWFGDMQDVAQLKSRKVWFTKDAAFDKQVKQFQSDYEQAASGQLDRWLDSPQGCLGLALLLDQFPRNLFRGQPRSFATDAKALSVVQHAIAQRFDRQLPPVQRQFLYFPMEHSENLEHQRQSVKLFHQFSDNPDLSDTYDFALRHQAIIQRFGRFPHRNQILRRATTPEEAEFLTQPGSSF